MNEYAEMLTFVVRLSLGFVLFLLAYSVFTFTRGFMRPILADVGTRSLLYGAHCFLIHPWFVALAWWKLYRFPWDPRLWVAFIVHDWGYLACREMDGEQGEKHPYLGAAIMVKLFGHGFLPQFGPEGHTWWTFMVGHSRFLSKQLGREPSMLCWADKYAFALEPAWMYLPRVRWSGELQEYMADGERRYGLGAHASPRDWHEKAQARMARVAFAGAAQHYSVVDQLTQRQRDGTIDREFGVDRLKEGQPR